MQILEDISIALQSGRAKIVKELVNQAVADKVDVKDILNSMLDGMSVIGGKFKRNEVFVPEVLIAARALNQGLEIIKPILTQTGVEAIGTAVIGTVEGDLHDIGKNLVKMMLVGAGLDVVDLGVDVTSEKFIAGAKEHNAKIICMSALLTTTMTNMQKVVSDLNDSGERDKFVVMIGGAPITTSFAEQIGADYYTPDAATAAEVARAVFTK